MTEPPPPPPLPREDRRAVRTRPWHWNPPWVDAVFIGGVAVTVIGMLLFAFVNDHGWSPRTYAAIAVVLVGAVAAFVMWRRAPARQGGPMSLVVPCAATAFLCLEYGANPWTMTLAGAVALITVVLVASWARPTPER